MTVVEEALDFRVLLYHDAVHCGSDCGAVLPHHRGGGLQNLGRLRAQRHFEKQASMAEKEKIKRKDK